jgi:hypothetical protein
MRQKKSDRTESFAATGQQKQRFQDPTINDTATPKSLQLDLPCVSLQSWELVGRNERNPFAGRHIPAQEGKDTKDELQLTNICSHLYPLFS